MIKQRKLKNSELDRLSVEEFKEASKLPLTVILDNIRSLNNTGSVFRSSDAFRVKEVVLCGITATPPHKDIHKTALGATESVAWRYEKNTLDVIHELQSAGVVCLAVEQAEGAVMLNQFQPDPNKAYALVFGNEVKGVQQEVVTACDAVIEIPQHGTKHSLNISVSAGVVLWDMFAKMDQEQP